MPPRHQGRLLPQDFDGGLGDIGLASQILLVYAQGLSLVVVKPGHASLQAFRHRPGRPASHERGLPEHQVIERSAVLQVMFQILLMNLQGFTLMFEEEVQPLIQTLQSPLRFFLGLRSGRNGPRRNTSLRSPWGLGGGHRAHGTRDLMTIVQCVLESLLRLFANVIRPGQRYGRRASVLPVHDRFLRPVRIDVTQGKSCNTQFDDRLSQLPVTASLRARVQRHGRMRLSLQDVAHELGQDAPRAEFHEESPPVLVHVLYFFLEQDRVEDVLRQPRLDGPGVFAIGTARRVRIDRTLRA